MLLICCLVALVLQASAKKVVFERYEPSLEEKKWTQNVRTWQNDVCSHLSVTEVMYPWIDIVKKMNSMSYNEWRQYMLDPSEHKDSPILSHFHYTLNEHGEKPIKFAIPIEPFVGLLRDPRKCLDVKSENFTESKVYLLPLSSAGFDMLHPNNNTKHIHDSLDSTQSHSSHRTHIFDAGATYWGDFEGSASMKFLTTTYRNLNLTIDSLTGWEAKKIEPQSKILKDVPTWLLPKFTYINEPICSTSQNDPRHNVIQHISNKVKKSDYVIFKLDIDKVALEQDYIKYIKDHAGFRDLVDEFYYEEHFNNKAMLIHGWGGYPTTLADYYEKTGVPLRTKGFRIHYWP